MVTHLLNPLIDAWRRRRLTTPRYRRVRFYESHADVPASLSRRTVAVVGSPDLPKWAVFECPCGRGHRIMLNLSPNRQPAWQLDPADGVTIRPSIDETATSCHYWIRGGRVQWAAGSHA
jgi:hypothetical protein